MNRIWKKWWCMNSKTQWKKASLTVEKASCPNKRPPAKWMWVSPLGSRYPSPCQAFTWLLPPSIAWLQPPERSWARNTQLSYSSTLDPHNCEIINVYYFNPLGFIAVIQQWITHTEKKYGRQRVKVKIMGFNNLKHPEIPGGHWVTE